MNTLFVLSLLLLTMEPSGSTYPWSDSTVVIADFEDDTPGALPSGWGYLSNRNRRFQSASAQMGPNQKFEVHVEEGNGFVRAYTRGEAQRISIRAEALKWKLSEYPRLRWSWRALQLPEGAREDRVNDSGGAIYVSFSKTDWLGRPLSIKYTYSSTLPVGTVVSTGNVKIIVASSGLNGIGHWLTVDRNVKDDYRRVFGSDPPDEPFTITLWSDSDNTGSTGKVDFDNIEMVKE